MYTDERSEKLRNLQAERTDLVSQLTSPYSSIGDWRLVKQQEAIMLGIDLPYTEEKMREYFNNRAIARTRINKLDEQIKAVENESIESNE